MILEIAGLILATSYVRRLRYAQDKLPSPPNTARKITARRFPQRSLARAS